MIITVAFLISMLISLSLLLLITKMGNQGLVFLKDDEAKFSRFNVFQIFLPSFLVPFSVITFIVSSTGVVIQSIQFVCLVYISIIMSLFNRRRLKKNKAIKLKKLINSSLVEPWIYEVTKRNEVQFKTNIYFFNGSIKGEVVIYMSVNELTAESISLLKNNLEKYNIILHFRANNFPNKGA